MSAYLFLFDDQPGDQFKAIFAFFVLDGDDAISGGLQLLPYLLSQGGADIAQSSLQQLAITAHILPIPGFIIEDITEFFKGAFAVYGKQAVYLQDLFDVGKAVAHGAIIPDIGQEEGMQGVDLVVFYAF